MAAAWRRGFARLASVACGKKPVRSASDRAEQLYAQIVGYAGGRPLSPAEWASFERQHDSPSRSPFRNQLVGCLVAKRDRALAQSLLEYVESAGGGVTRTFLAHYLALCSTEQEADACLRRILESSGGLLDAATRDLVVRALCQTPLWKRATDLLDKPQPSSEATNAVAVAAFAHGDHATAWQCLERLWGSSPLRVFPATLEACLGAAATLAESDRPDEGRRLVDRLLAHLAQSKGPVPSALALDLAGFYDKWAPAGWTSGSARISSPLTCSRRQGRPLQPLRLPARLGPAQCRRVGGAAAGRARALPAG